MKSHLGIGFIIFLAAGCSGIKHVFPSETQKSTSDLLESLVEPSEIVLPVNVPLTSLVSLADIESRVPMSASTGDAWNEIPEQGSGKAIQYHWERSLFEVSAHDSTLVVSTELRYQIKYAERVKQPWPFTNYTWITFGSCGYDEPLRRVRMKLTSNLSLHSGWKLSSTTAITTEFIDKCQATILKFDVTDRIKNIIDKQLANVASKIDQRIPESVSVRTYAEDLWQKMLQPISIDTNLGLWLAIQPHGILLTPPTITNGEVSFIFYLRCRPLITLGGQPEPIRRSFTEIPVARPDSGFHIEPLLNLTHAQTTQILKNRFVGTSHTFSGNRTLQIDSVDISGDETSTSLTVDFHGDLNGRIHLSGRPVFDQSTETLSLADLEYSISTSNIIFQISDWWNHSERLAELRQRATWDLTHELHSGLNKLNSLLSTSKVGHVHLGGSLQHIHVLGIVPIKTSLVCGFAADGTVRIQIQ